jgi:phosphate transport system substrate-binding protein
MLRILKLAALVSVALASPALADELTGVGGTAIYPVLSQWASAYGAKTGIKVNYQALGSGAGIKQIEAKTADFGNSDMPLHHDDLTHHDLMQFPQVIISITPVVHLAGIKSGDLTLDGPTLADVYLGKIAYWDEPALARLNPKLILPHQPITIVYRSDGSGTTFNFTNYLSKVSPEWSQKVGADTSVSWPKGIGGKGNAGVATYVQQIDGSIGYVEYAYVLETGLVFTRMLNHDGKTVLPSMATFQAAAASADFSKAQDFYLILTDQPGSESWPIIAATYMLMRKDAPGAQSLKVMKFLDWALRNGQTQATALDYIPLPEALVARIENAWATQLKYQNGKAVWSLQN